MISYSFFYIYTLSFHDILSDRTIPALLQSPQPPPFPRIMQHESQILSVPQSKPERVKCARCSHTAVGHAATARFGSPSGMTARFAVRPSLASGTQHTCMTRREMGVEIVGQGIHAALPKGICCEVRIAHISAAEKRGIGRGRRDL